MEQQHKNAIITGANKGLGRAVLSSMAKEGYNIWACSSMQNVEFEQACKEIATKCNIWIENIYFDLSDYQEIKEAYKFMMKKDKRIDVLINNAGVGHMNLLLMTKPSDIERLYKVNVLAPIYLSQLVVRNMMKGGEGGNIINISSTAAKEVYEGNCVYGSSKAAVNAFTKVFAAEVYRYGICVNAIAPGLMDTDMAQIFEGKQPEKPLQHTALGRKICPEEIAEIVTGLLSDKYGLINGEVLCVNGGHR